MMIKSPTETTVFIFFERHQTFPAPRAEKPAEKKGRATVAFSIPDLPERLAPSAGMGGQKGKSKGGAKGRGGGKKASAAAGGNRGGDKSDPRALRAFVSSHVELAWVASADEATRAAFLDHASTPPAASALETSFAAVRECVEQRACSERVKDVAVHALALVRSGEVERLAKDAKTRSTEVRADPSTPTSAQARTSTGSSTFSSVDDDSDSDSDGEDAAERKRDAELARCLLGSGGSDASLAVSDFAIVEAPVDSDHGATVRFAAASAGRSAEDARPALRAALERGLAWMARVQGEGSNSSEGSKKTRDAANPVEKSSDASPPSGAIDANKPQASEDPTLYLDHSIQSHDRARAAKADLEHFASVYRQEWHVIAGLQASCAEAGRDWDGLAQACHAWMLLSDRRREFHFEKQLRTKFESLKMHDHWARESARIHRSFDARHGGHLGGGLNAAAQSGFSKTPARTALGAQQTAARQAAMDDMKRGYDEADRELRERETMTPRVEADRLIYSANAAIQAYMDYLTRLQMRLSAADPKEREEQSKEMHKEEDADVTARDGSDDDEGETDDVDVHHVEACEKTGKLKAVNTDGSFVYVDAPAITDETSANAAIAAALDAAHKAKSAGKEAAADAAAAAFGKFGLITAAEKYKASAAEKYKAEWDQEVAYAATSVQRAEWLAMTQEERDREMAVRQERCNTVYVHITRWNAATDALKQKQRSRHNNAGGQYWNTQDILGHVQQMERTVFAWLKGHQREVHQAELKLQSLMEKAPDHASLGVTTPNNRTQTTGFTTGGVGLAKDVAGPRLNYDVFPSKFLNKLNAIGEEYESKIRAWRDEISAGNRAIHETAANTVARAMFSQTCARLACTFAEAESDRRREELDDLVLLDDAPDGAGGSKKKPKKKKKNQNAIVAIAGPEASSAEPETRPAAETSRLEPDSPMDDSAAEVESDRDEHEPSPPAPVRKSAPPASSSPEIEEIEEIGEGDDLGSDVASGSEGVDAWWGIERGEKARRDEGSDWVAAGPKPRKTREQRARERHERAAAERADAERAMRRERELRERKARERERWEREEAAARAAAAAASRPPAAGSPPPLPPGPPPASASATTHQTSPPPPAVGSTRGGGDGGASSPEAIPAEDDEALRIEAIRIGELESRAAKAAKAAQAAAEAAIAAAAEAAKMQAEAEAAMREARRSRETLAKAATGPVQSANHTPGPVQSANHASGPDRSANHASVATAPPPPPGAPPGVATHGSDSTMTKPVAAFFAGASNRAKAPSPPRKTPTSDTPGDKPGGEGGKEADSEEEIRRLSSSDFPALSPSAAAGKAAEKRAAPLIAAHKRAAETSNLPVGAKPFDPNMAKAILAGMRDGDPNKP